MQKNYHELLVKCLLDIILFVEFLDEKNIDQDAALEILEKIAYDLSLLSNEEKKEISLIILTMAADYSPKEKKFITTLPEVLGLI